MVKLKVIRKYQDLQLDRKVLPDEILEVSRERAELLVSLQYAKILKLDKLKKVKK